MAQLRDDFNELTARNAVVLVVGPENRAAFSEYWQKNSLPFIGMPDPSHQVLKQYGQEVNLFKLGRMPAMVIIDPEGQVRFVHYGKEMSDIPSNQEVLDTLDQINQGEDD
jgi:peroxiredoxin